MQEQQEEAVAAAAAAQEVYELCGQMCIMQFYSGRAKKETITMTCTRAKNLLLAALKAAPLKRAPPSLFLRCGWSWWLAGWLLGL